MPYDYLGPQGKLPLWKIRKSLKKKLSAEKLVSVQMDIKTNETGTQMVFLRIATTPTLKNIEKAEKNLLIAKPTFLVYFPGEQYFYADSSVPNENHCQVRFFQDFEKQIMESPNLQYCFQNTISFALICNGNILHSCEMGIFRESNFFLIYVKDFVFNDFL